MLLCRYTFVINHNGLFYIGYFVFCKIFKALTPTHSLEQFVYTFIGLQ